MLSKLMTLLFHRQPIDNSQEIEEVKRESHETTKLLKEQSIERSKKVQAGFEQTSKKMYDVAEKIYIATGHR